MPWHAAKRGSAQKEARSAAVDIIVVRVDTLKVGALFATVLTGRYGKVVESLPGDEGVVVKLYVPGDGWIEKFLHCSCPVKVLG